MSPVTPPSHRFAPNTADNHSSQLWISSILCLIYCTLVLIVRLHIKWKLYGTDDAAISLATALQLGENIPLFIALNNGLGTSIQKLTYVQLTTIGQAVFAAQLFFILTLAASKLSVAALMLRLFTRDIVVTRRSRLLCYVTTAIVVLWAIGSLVATTIPCSPSQYVQDISDGSCNNRLGLWKAIAAFDILTEVLLVTLPMLFVWPIQMKRYIKVQVAIAFGFRLPLVAIAAVHLHYVAAYSDGANTTQAIIPALVLQQCELLWSLLSATIPTLKAFMRTFNSGFGMEIDLDSPYGHRSGPQDSKTYILGSAQHPAGHENTIQAAIEIENQAPLPSQDQKLAKVCALNDGATDSSASCTQPQSSLTSHSSQDMIIEREVAWRVSFEHRKQKVTASVVNQVADGGRF